jgi:hypothetical protein
MSARINKEKIRKNIALILDRVKTEADPHLLNEYRRLFKKEVSFFRRSWAAAYLLMLLDQGSGIRTPGKFDGGQDRSKNRQGGGNKPRFSEEKNSAGKNAGAGINRGERQYPLADEDSRRLFISIGRKRRVFPREILGLINARTATPREDIGAIRILDNYSFVQVRDTAADLIIKELNGLVFRGKTLTVNYAKSKKDGGFDVPDEYSETQDEAAADADSIAHNEFVE